MFAVMATGCATKEDLGTLIGAGGGALLGSALSHGSPGGIIAGALVGGFIGNRIGKSMDDEDRRRAYEAQVAAFEGGRPVGLAQPERPLRIYRAAPRLHLP